METQERAKKIIVSQMEEIRRLRNQIQKLNEGNKEPLAIIGLGLRLPAGIENAEALRQALLAQKDLLSEVPAERWSTQFLSEDENSAGRFYADSAGFLEDIQLRDFTHFGISPREAEKMDPQQSLLLECTWHALEDAAIDPTQVEKLGRTGVFIGAMGAEYSKRSSLLNGSEGIDFHSGTGCGHSFLSGRVSYTYGLSGPSLTLDTACSSSLVALHQARTALDRGECDLAIVGGVNVLLDPDLNIALCQGKALSKSGQCRAFDDAADGYVRGEGCVVLVLAREGFARQSRRRIYGKILGSAVNHVGRSSGLTVPNGPAQEEVIKAALQSAGVRAQDVTYVETHGTGTKLGDPIEMRAIEKCYGARVGTLKPNIGHLEAASGLAAIAKILLMFKHNEVYPVKNVSTPHQEIPWAKMRCRLALEPDAYFLPGEGHLAAVSSFGISGTNAHAILAPAELEAGQHLSPPQPWRTVLPISSRSIESLQAQREAVLTFARGALDDGVLKTACIGRAHLSKRDAVVFLNRQPVLVSQVLPAVPPSKALRVWIGACFDGLEELMSHLVQDASYEAYLKKAQSDFDTVLLPGRENQGAASRNAVSHAVALARLWFEWTGRELEICGLGLELDVLRLLQCDSAIRGSFTKREAHVQILHDAEAFSNGFRVSANESAALPLMLGRIYSSGWNIHWEKYVSQDSRFSSSYPVFPFHRTRAWVTGTLHPRKPQAEMVLVGERANERQKDTSSPNALNAVPADLLKLAIQEILQLEVTDWKHSFQELGGDSFTGMLVAQRLEEQGHPIAVEHLLGMKPLRNLINPLSSDAELRGFARA